MKVGAALHIFWDDMRMEVDVDKALAEIADIGFYSAEFLCDTSFFPGWGENDLFDKASAIKAKLDNAGLKATIHAPHYDFNIAVNNAGLRSEMAAQVRDCIDVAATLGSDVVVLHPGTVSSRKFTRQSCLDRAVGFLGEMEGYAGDLGVRICLENEVQSRKSLCFEPEEMRAVLDEINSKNVGVCLDIAHVNTTKRPLKDFLGLLRKDIFHVHISDNVGDSHHLPIGKGDIDFRAAIAELRPYGGILNIEGWITDGRKTSLTNSRRHLVELIGLIRGE